MFGVLAASFHFGLVIRLRKRLLLARSLGNWAIGGEIQLWELELVNSNIDIVVTRCGVPLAPAYLRSVMGCLKHYRAVSKLLYEAVFALDGYIAVSTLSRI